MPLLPYIKSRLRGTFQLFFRIGAKGAGVRLNGDASGLSVGEDRDTNPADLQVRASRGVFTLAAGVRYLNKLTGKYIGVGRSATGPTNSYELSWPDGPPSPGDVTVWGASSGNNADGDPIYPGSFAQAGGAGSASALKSDTTTITSGSGTTTAMFNLPVGGVAETFRFVVRTAFNGTTAPTITVGTTGQTAKYVGADEVDLTQAMMYEVDCAELPPAAAAEPIIATFTPGTGATVGSVEIQGIYCIPS